MLLEQLQSYEPDDATEAAHLKATIAFLQQTARPFHRETLEGHITGSAIVVNSAQTHILLLHHRQLNRWLQPGGHCDGQANTLAVAMREVQEETGLASIAPAIDDIFDLDVHRIPAKPAVPEHWHYDVRYLLVADDQEPLRRSPRETIALQWIPLAKLPQFTADEALCRAAVKLSRLKREA